MSAMIAGNPSSTEIKLRRAKAAAPRLAQLSSLQKNAILLVMADAILNRTEEVLAANRIDLESSNLSPALRDRLLLNEDRIQAMVAGVHAVANLPDPVYEMLSETTRPNGLRIRKVRVPLGVIGVVYESRPNVTVDTTALALKTGNATVLRGGKEALHSNQKLVEILIGVAGLPDGAIEILDASTRQSTEELIQARGLVDVLIPRGGAALISYVAENATVPVIQTGAGNCHIFVDESADHAMADEIVVNAKTQRPSVCNAAEKLLVHRNIALQYIPHIVKKLMAAGVEVRGDEETRRLSQNVNVVPAQEQDWHEEYSRLCMAVRVVGSLEDAIAHINRYSTQHSDAIVTSNEARARQFLRQVDSAAVYWNASTRFSDGGEFGFGAEMGISTQKLHARGPFALAELTSTKYEIIGTGQIRK